jgi:hypothetical protein
MYERKGHFKDGINQFQGKQNVTIDKKVYEDLEDQFKKNGLLTDSDIQQQKYKNITKDQITLFLKLTGHVKHYEDVVLIYHKMTGKSVPVIDPELEMKLMQDFEKVSDTYDKLFKIKGKINRKSFINKHYILYQLLRKHKYECSINDFNILKTTERQLFHDDIVRQIFENLEWNFSSIF